MRRRAVLWVFAILTLLFVTAGAALALLLRHVPAYYARNALSEGPERKNLCREFRLHSVDCFTALFGDQPAEYQFSQDQFNSYFQDPDDGAESSARIVEISESIHDIRVAFEDDLVRLGLRYGTGRSSSIISIDFRVWLVARKPNVIALELCSFRAGALPLGTQVLLDSVSEAARRLNIEVTWYRSQGHPVALLQLQANQPRPTFQIRRLEVKPGRLVIASSPVQEFAQPAPPEPAPGPP
jgi:hypothetical protein